MVHRAQCAAQPGTLTGGALLLNKAQLSDFLGYSEQTLGQWQEEGLPIARRALVRGQPHEYDSAAVVAWLLDRAERKARADNPKDQLYASQVKLNELKIGELEGRLVNIQDAEAGFTRMIVNARQRLLQIPEVLADVLAGLEAVAVRDCLRAAIHEALVELARYDPSDTPEGDACPSDTPEGAV